MVLSDAPLQKIGHSFYSALIPFPIVCFILAFLTDLAYWASASVLWETMSVRLLTIGLLVAAFAIAAGIADVVRSRRVAGLGQPAIAVAGQILAIGLSLANVLVHSRDGYTAVVPQGLALSFITVLVLVGTSILGRSGRASAGGSR